MPDSILDELLDNVSLKIFGMRRSSAIANSLCVVCHELTSGFRDQASIEEYGRSAMCQKCQDQTFSGN